MQIRCYRCGWSFAIKKDEAAFALQALEETGGTHYDSSCPRCRHSNRISLEQLRKAAPRSANGPSSDRPQEAQGVDAEGPEPESGEPEPETKDSVTEVDSGGSEPEE